MARASREAAAQRRQFVFLHGGRGAGSNHRSCDAPASKRLDLLARRDRMARRLIVGYSGERSAHDELI
jgi:hypothetical protein